MTDISNIAFDLPEVNSQIRDLRQSYTELGEALQLIAQANERSSGELSFEWDKVYQAQENSNISLEDASILRATLQTYESRGREFSETMRRMDGIDLKKLFIAPNSYPSQ